MILIENLRKAFNNSLIKQKSQQTEKTKEWKLLGQEQNGNLIVCWLSIGLQCNNIPGRTCIGLYNINEKHLKILHKFDNIYNIIQATINLSQSILCFVTKQQSCSMAFGMEAYRIHLLLIRSDDAEISTPQPVGPDRPRQAMVQFLYPSRRLQNGADKLLIMVHQEAITLNTLEFESDQDTTQVSGWAPRLRSENLAGPFTWAQWDPIQQSLYFIHLRLPQSTGINLVGEEGPTNNELSPTLSCLQFHDELPHETVLNIPLNIPTLPQAATTPCSVYEDDPIPLRVHDCTLDLRVVSDPSGLVAICHHYLYQPVQAPGAASGTSVHLAYSVTLLHHGTVIHCVNSHVGWAQARATKPVFSLYGEDHLLVYVPRLLAHLLDVGASHEPCCHVMTSDTSEAISSEYDKLIHLVPLIKHSSQPQNGIMCLDLVSLDVYHLQITNEQLAKAFHEDGADISNRLAIIHYLLVHRHEIDTVNELLFGPLCSRPLDLSFNEILQELLIAHAYASTVRTLAADSLVLSPYLPLTARPPGPELEIKIEFGALTLTQERLWNTAMMLLSPRQRLVPYRADIWTRLWELLDRPARRHSRFQPKLVADKLMLSLGCYQPEALSRSSTPLSPAGLPGASTLAELGVNSADALPFPEMESGAASKQEHVLAVNLRELSMHLVKAGTTHSGRSRPPGMHGCMGGHAGNGPSPIHVHVVATRYVSAQLEAARFVCLQLCRRAGADPRHHHTRGFDLIDELSLAQRVALFRLLERYSTAIAIVAFPLPPGYASFLAYLGFRVFSQEMFFQYAHRNALELNIDVMKAIMADTPDTVSGVAFKLRLIKLLPRSRGRRLLNQWSHAASLMFRAREHALHVLSGVQPGPGGAASKQIGPSPARGLAAFPSGDRLSPLDTFLDLLTAKASLNELDFGLLIEATICSTEEFLIE